jgi:hypothetical protein
MHAKRSEAQEESVRKAGHVSGMRRSKAAREKAIRNASEQVRGGGIVVRRANGKYFLPTLLGLVWLLSDGLITEQEYGAAAEEVKWRGDYQAAAVLFDRAHDADEEEPSLAAQDQEAAEGMWPSHG